MPSAWLILLLSVATCALLTGLLSTSAGRPLWHSLSPSHLASSFGGLTIGSGPVVDLVVASMSHDNTSWVYDVRPSWNKKVYVADDPNATYSLPENKGNEAMTYLTYIIDHYDQLPDIAVFQHSKRYQWHNDDPLYDGAARLEQFNLTYVQEQGYANMRCNWRWGCNPAYGRPFHDEDNEVDYSRARWKQAFEYIFPGEEVPELVGMICCAQFGVTRERMLLRTRAQYERIREWLFATDMSNLQAGQLLEGMWHIIFGAPAYNCLPAKDCYCRTYGLCDLKCDGDNSCDEWYTQPAQWRWKSAHGWDGKHFSNGSEIPWANGQDIRGPLAPSWGS